MGKITFLGILFSLAGWVLHKFFLGTPMNELRVLDFHYLYHFCFLLLTMGAFVLMNKLEKLQLQLGFIYLAFLGARLVLYMLVFLDSGINFAKPLQLNSYHLIFPLFFTLTPEVVFLIKLLQSPTKKSV